MAAGGLAEDPFAHAPISKLVGFEVLAESEGAPGETIVVIDCDRRHHNPMGRVHGGLIAALADAAMGIAFGRTLTTGQGFSTIEMKVNFLRPVTRGRLEARARIVERGLRIGFVECRVVGPRGKTVATGTSTCTVISSI
jgi:uncharacterized protein (TIGR00369 family)